MIENTRNQTQRDRAAARRKGVAPSSSLRRHFYSLARQVRRWSDAREERNESRGTVIGVTSLQAGAGKSTVAFNLACSLKSLSRSPVLLVEADLGRHYITRRLGVNRAPGLTELLLDVATMEEAVFPTPITDLHVMGCGRKNEQEALELPFECLEPMVAESFGDYGHVIFDLPLATQLTACHAMVPYLDGVILTVEANQIDRRQIERFRHQIQTSGVEVIGLVLNKA